MPLFSRNTKWFILVSLIITCGIILSDLYVALYRESLSIHQVTEAYVSYIKIKKSSPMREECLLEFGVDHRSFSQFNIKWGLRLEDINEKDGKLYDHNHNRFVFATGYFNRILQKQYEQCSHQIYDALKQIYLYQENETGSDVLSDQQKD